MSLLHLVQNPPVHVVVGLIYVLFTAAILTADDSLQFEVQVDTPLEHDDGVFLWYHPRAAAITGNNGPEVLITLQKHLKVSDYYSGLYAMRRLKNRDGWSEPVAIPELEWRHQDQVTIGVADVTPGWHAPTNRLLAFGCQVPYSPNGQQIVDGRPRQHQTAYTLYNPENESWSSWKILAM